MREKPLAGKGILVTRPIAQNGALMQKIADKGGAAIAYPVIEIQPRDTTAVARHASQLPCADIAIFVSPNAAELGARFSDAARIAAIGTATAEALAASGQPADIVPSTGFDSESLLRHSVFDDIDGQCIWIVRADSGRELLAQELRSRGAMVHYLPVYRRHKPTVDAATQEQVQSLWFDGGIDAITAMSVESLTNLLELLPDQCSSDLARLPLVTPARRVIKELLSRHPNAKHKLAADPSAGALVDAIEAVLEN